MFSSGFLYSDEYNFHDLKVCFFFFSFWLSELKLKKTWNFSLNTKYSWLTYYPAQKIDPTEMRQIRVLSFPYTTQRFFLKKYRLDKLVKDQLAQNYSLNYLFFLMATVKTQWFFPGIRINLTVLLLITRNFMSPNHRGGFRGGGGECFMDVFFRDSSPSPTKGNILWHPFKEDQP